MLKAFKIQVAFINLIFGAFGFALLKVLDIQNLPSFVTGVGMMFSLILSFICSTLLLSRLTAKKARYLKFAATLLFAISLLTFFQLQQSLDKHTVDLKEFFGDSLVINRYFTGTTYTRLAQDYKIHNPLITDEEIIAASENNIYNVWTSQSVKAVIRQATWVYFLFIFSIVSSLSILTPLLYKPGKKPKPTTSSVSKPAFEP